MRDFGTEGLILAEYQAKLFEASTTKFNCSSGIFIRRFLHSNVLKMLDKNASFLINYTIDEALDEIENQFGKTDYGTIQYSPEIMFWLGYVYRYISYTREISTNLLMKLFNYKKIVGLYFVYHTQDMEWCIRSILEIFNCDERIFDPNYRLKQIIKRHYLKNTRK